MGVAPEVTFAVRLTAVPAETCITVAPEEVTASVVAVCVEATL
jgi:hypothetical protein